MTAKSAREVLEDFYHKIDNLEGTKSFFIRRGKAIEALDTVLTSLRELVERVKPEKKVDEEIICECGRSIEEGGIRYNDALADYSKRLMEVFE